MALLGCAPRGILGLFARKDRGKAARLAHAGHHRNRRRVRVGRGPRRGLGGLRGRLRLRRDRGLPRLDRRRLGHWLEVVGRRPARDAVLLDEPPAALFFLFQVDNVALAERKLTLLNRCKVVQGFVARAAAARRRRRRRSTRRRGGGRRGCRSRRRGGSSRGRRSSSSKRRRRSRRKRRRCSRSKRRRCGRRCRSGRHSRRSRRGRCRRHTA